MSQTTKAIKIKTNVNSTFLRYDWNISREHLVFSKDGKRKYNINYLLSVKNQELTSENKTQIHQLQAGIKNVTYISEIRVYLKDCKNAEIFSGMYTLDEIINGQIHLDTDYTEAPHYKTTIGKTSTEEKSIVTCQISQPKRAFFSDQFSEEQYLRGEISTQQNDLFNKEKFEMDLKQRISRKTFPDQAGSSLCGPAAFFFCLLRDRPDIYAQMARELWKYGKTKLGKLIIKPSKGCLHMKTDVEDKRRNPIGLDWITLASLRDSSNIFMEYDTVSDEVSGISLPSSLSSWFRAIGCHQLDDTTSLFFKGQKEVFIKLNDYHKKGKNVILFVSANVILGEDGRKTKDHWVVLEQDASNFSNDELVNFYVFSWGDIKYPNRELTMQGFYNGFYGGLVFEPIK